MQQLGLFIDLYEEIPGEIPIIETRNKYVVQEGLMGVVAGAAFQVTQLFEQALEFLNEGKEITEDELLDFTKAYWGVFSKTVSIIGTKEDNSNLVILMAQMDAAYVDFMVELQRLSLGVYWAAALLAKHGDYLPPVRRRR